VSQDDSEMERLRAENVALRRELLHIRQPWRRALDIDESGLRTLVEHHVRPAYPRIIPASGVDYDALAVAFAFMSTLGRTDMPDHRRYIMHWADLGADWARENNAGDIGSVLLAAVCHADVPFALGDSSSGAVAALGVVQWGGRPASHRYRAVLAGTARLLPPTSPPRSRLPALPSQVLIVGGDRSVGAGPVFR
jgi:hypothetical protein